MKNKFILPVAVRNRISERLGAPVIYPADCERLSISIRNVLNENIGVTTIKRLFGFVSDVREPRVSTLDILAKYCGFPSYYEMIHTLAGGGDSDFEDKPDLSSSDLKPGAVVEFEYLPDRAVSLLYLGNDLYRVTKSTRGSLQPDNILNISCFVKNKPLIVTNVEHEGENLGRYLAGKHSGLTALSWSNHEN